MFEKVNVPILGVVENMSYLEDEESGKKSYLFGQGGGSKRPLPSKTSFLGEIPLHQEVRMGRPRYAGGDRQPREPRQYRYPRSDQVLCRE